MPRTILVTAFDPFGGETLNPAREIAAQLPAEVNDARIITLDVPTAFSSVAGVLQEGIGKHRPDAIVCLGQAGGRHAISVERVAINIADAPIPDNEGTVLSDAPINPSGPAAYFATLPVKAMVQAIRASGIPADLSHTAGTFVCNYLMYTALDILAGTETLAGFIHVPYIPAQAKEPSLPLDDLVRGVTAALEVLTVDSAAAADIRGSLH